MRLVTGLIGIVLYLLTVQSAQAWIRIGIYSRRQVCNGNIVFAFAAVVFGCLIIVYHQATKNRLVELDDDMHLAIVFVIAVVTLIYALWFGNRFMLFDPPCQRDFVDFYKSLL